MYDVGFSQRPDAMSIDAQFQDVYRKLETLQESRIQIESIIQPIVRCSRELHSLERIHLNRWRFYGPEAPEDPFELRDVLNKFMISCNAVAYLSSSFGDFDEDIGDGCLFPSKRGWKKKQVKALEADFSEHERNLSLACSNIVYTTALKIHQSPRASDAGLALILRRAERRHAQLERQTSQSRNMQTKAADSKIEEMDWELSLRRYFDCMETWAWEPEHVDPATSQPSSRTSSFTQAGYVRPSIQRQRSNASMRSNSGRSSYGAYRGVEDVDANRFYRQPRRRGSTSNVVGYTPVTGTAALQHRNSITNSFSKSCNALVLYDSNSGPSTAVTTPRPIRRSSISGDFHWEYIGKSSTFQLLAPLTTRWPELKDAQVDIYTQTEGMTPKEARAYASGRLAGLSPEITNEVRRVLSMKKPSQEQLPRLAQVQQQYPGRPQYLSNHQVQPPFQYRTAQAQSAIQLVDNRERDELIVKNEPKRKSLTLESLERQSNYAAYPQPSTSPVSLSSGPLVRRSVPKPQMPSPINRGPSSPPIPQAPACKSPASTTSSKRSFFGSLTDLRPLTAISERPSTGKSRASSMEKPPSRSLMQTFIYKRTNLSQQVLETVADKPEGGRSSSGSDTLTSDRDVDFSAKSKPTTPKGVINTHKPLPPKPKSSNRVRLLTMFKSRMKGNSTALNVPFPPSTLSLQNSSKFGKSRESLRMSMELLKRRDSNMTLLAEGMEVPFEIWLRALPYIEGRCSTLC